MASLQVSIDLIDDSASVREVLRVALEAEGPAIIEAADWINLVPMA